MQTTTVTTAPAIAAAPAATTTTTAMNANEEQGPAHRLQNIFVNFRFSKSNI